MFFNLSMKVTTAKNGGCGDRAHNSSILNEGVDLIIIIIYIIITVQQCTMR